MNNFYVDYIVNEEKGVVVCVISDCEFNAVALVDKYTGIFNIGNFPESFCLSSQYKGVAKCLPEDTFDEEYGKKLAYRKAYLKYATALEKKTKYIVNSHKSFLESIQRQMGIALEKVNGKTKNATELYDKVLGESK